MALFSIALMLATVMLYYPVHSYPFCDLDDVGYVYNNPRVGPLDWPAIKWAFTHPFILNYDPLTLIAHSVNVQLFQQDSGAHHEVNVVLHAINAVLVFWVLVLATGFMGRSLMVAALFALHPMNVENVAWISELKTLLSTAFFLLALGAYGWYARNPKWQRMMLVTLFFGLGLMAKPQVITLPFVLLLWDYWPLQRFSPGRRKPSGVPRSPETSASPGFVSLLKEKIPLFVVAAVDAALTIIAARKTSTESWPYTLSIRLGNGILSYGRYLVKALWPAHLALMYPHPGFSLRWSHVAFSFVCLAAITGFVITQRQHRFLVVGWLWFLGTMVPTIGIIQIDLPAMADRYAYVPFIGLFVMACWGAAELAGHWSLPKFVLPVTSCALLLALAATTYRQIGYWRDNIILWTHSVEVTGHNYVAHLRLSDIYREKLQREKALEELYLADRDKPEDLGIELDIAFLEHWRKHLPQAMVYYQKVLANSKDDAVKAQVLANMGHIYGDLGDVVRAKECYVASTRLHSPSLPPTPAAINWQGDWWNDVGRLIRERFHSWEHRQ
jgi:hypothetical protein